MRRSYYVSLGTSLSVGVQPDSNGLTLPTDDGYADELFDRTGVLTKFTFSNPHIQLVLEVEREDGVKETWRVESMNPGRWDRSGNPRDVADVGETVTLLGWPAREDIPEETVKRD